jgi:hypothetical protein
MTKKSWKAAFERQTFGEGNMFNKISDRFPFAFMISFIINAYKNLYEYFNNNIEGLENVFSIKAL